MILNDLQCRNAQPKEKPFKLSDGGGLYLEVAPTGRKYWRLKYRLLGKEKRIAFGVYPDVTLSEARTMRDDAKRSIRNHIDPAEIKREKKRLALYNSEQTFEKVAREWHEYEKDTWSERHSKNILYRLELDVFPQIGRYPISKLTAPILAACFQKIQARGANEMAKRAIQVCSKVFRYSVITGRAERDLTIELKGALKKYNKGHYASIEVDELPDFVKVLYDNDSRLYKQTKIALKLMLLTFVRTSELIQAPRSEFNLEKAEWNIPAERMKMRKPHLVPLSKQAIKLINELYALNPNSEYLLPSVINHNKTISNNTLLSALDTLGYKGKMTGHGFRSLAMSAIKEKLGYRHEVVDRQLAHIPASKVDKAYDRAKFIEDRTKMMQDWSDYINTLR